MSDEAGDSEEKPGESGNKPPQPTEVQAEVVKLVQAGVDIDAACEAVGVSQALLGEWIGKSDQGVEPFASFADAITRAWAAAEASLVLAVRRGDERGSTGKSEGARWLLERRRNAIQRSHARGAIGRHVIPACPETVEERVEFVVGLMADLVYERGKTNRVLAAAWKLSESTIQNYSSEASRLVTADEDEARRDITAGCHKLMRAALEKGNAKDFKAVGELLASVSGAKAPEKREHKLTGVSLDDLDELKKSTGFEG